MSSEAGNAYSHLRGRAREVVLQSDAARIEFLRAERWIGYPRAMEAVERLEELLRWPKKQRMPNLLIIGPTNSGKSMIVEYLVRAHKKPSRPEVEPHPVLVMQMPAVPTLGRFYSAILESLGAPYRPRARAAELESLAIRILRDTDVKLLVIDELHNVLAAGTTARQDFLNELRYLGNELRIPLVGVGTRDAYLVIRSDPQLENRFEPLILPNWSLDADFLALLASFETMLPLKRASHLANPATAQYLLTRCEGTIGELSRLLTVTAELAISSGEERINEKTLAGSKYAGPGLRRQMFERTTG